MIESKSDSSSESLVFDSSEVAATNLWLITCDTRHNSSDVQGWMFTANQVQKLAAEKKDSRVQVEVRNACVGVEWKGNKSKPKAVAKFLNETFFATSEHYGIFGFLSNKMNKLKKIDTNSSNRQHNIVMFSDSDVFFNFGAVSAEEVIERFHQHRQNKPIIFSAEPNCWKGSRCTRNLVAELYPDAIRSHCPQFINTGGYMGYPKALLEMVSSKELQKKKYKSDQYQTMKWYRKNRDKATLDTHSALVRSLFTGWVDSSLTPQVPSEYTCGPYDAVGRCGHFDPPYTGSVHETAPAVEMDPVPNCTSYRYPFSIHGNGGETKLTVRRLLEELWKNRNGTTFI